MEIEFKAWDNVNNEWINLQSGGSNSKGKDYILCSMGNLWELVKVDGGVEIHSVDADVLQYSNIKDEFGEKLFDGDLVQCFNVGVSTVTFKSGTWGLLTDTMFVPFFEIKGYCKKIGSVYENSMIN